MKIYKLTNQDLTTRGGFKWEVGKWYETSGEGELCGPGWLHAYSDPCLAVLMNVKHANIQSPRLWVAEGEGEFKDDRGLKCGFTKMRIVEKMEIPSASYRVYIRFAIACARAVVHLYFDSRAENAIVATETFLASPTDKNKTNAYAAYYSAASYAYSATYSAAAGAAYSATYAAASAADVAYSATYAAYAAASAADVASYGVVGGGGVGLKLENMAVEAFNITTPEGTTAILPDDVFVFGSNAQGQHTGGAAKTAVEHFGAIMGQSEGMQGKSYAIPTMGTYDEMQEAINRFLDYAKKCQDKTFLVTRIGCGIAGKDEELVKSMFSLVPKWTNVILPEGWLNEKQL